MTHLPAVVKGVWWLLCRNTLQGQCHRGAGKGAGRSHRWSQISLKGHLSGFASFLHCVGPQSLGKKLSDLCLDGWKLLSLSDRAWDGKAWLWCEPREPNLWHSSWRNELLCHWGSHLSPLVVTGEQKLPRAIPETWGKRLRSPRIRSLLVWVRVQAVNVGARSLRALRGFPEGLSCCKRGKMLNPSCGSSSSVNPLNLCFQLAPPCL